MTVDVTELMARARELDVRRRADRQAARRYATAKFNAERSERRRLLREAIASGVPKGVSILLPDDYSIPDQWKEIR